PLAVAAALFEHPRELGPRLGGRMLAAELALAVTPATIGDDRRDPLIDPAGIDRDGAAEARADRRDAVGIDRRVLRQRGEGIARVRHLFQADHPCMFALAVAAAAH